MILSMLITMVLIIAIAYSFCFFFQNSYTQIEIPRTYVNVSQCHRGQIKAQRRMHMQKIETFTNFLQDVGMLNCYIVFSRTSVSRLNSCHFLSVYLPAMKCSVHIQLISYKKKIWLMEYKGSSCTYCGLENTKFVIESLKIYDCIVPQASIV